MSESPSSEFQRPLVISGPSGVGKSTLLKRLFEEFPDKFGFSISHTTRKQRPGEFKGVHYHFVNDEQFTQLVKNGAFIETTEFAGHCYGTTREAVSAVQQQGRRCLLDIESQGVKEIKRTRIIKPVFLFICPPSMMELRSRLQGRGTESEEDVQKRFETACSEIEYFKQPDNHDFLIVNGDDKERAYSLFKMVALGQPIISDPLPPLND